MNIYHANVNVSLKVENVTQIKSGITINVGVSTKNKKLKKKKKKNACKKNYISNPATHSCENFEYLTSSGDDLVITCDKIINGSANVMSNVSSNFHEKVRYKMDC